MGVSNVSMNATEKAFASVSATQNVSLNATEKAYVMVNALLTALETSASSWSLCVSRSWSCYLLYCASRTSLASVRWGVPTSCGSFD